MGTLFESGVRPHIDAWLLEESKKVRSYGNYWSASSSGYCMRKNIFERLGVPHVETESDARKQRVFTSGHIFHQWIQDITKKAGLSIAQELELQDEDLMIRGHIDDLILVGSDDLKDVANHMIKTGETPEPQRLILYDYKTVNSRSFMWAKKNGNAMSHFHRMQLGTYMYMLRGANPIYTFQGHPTKDLTEARILKIEKDTLMMMEQQLMWSEELEQDVLKYWTTLNKYWKDKKLPPCTCADHESGFMASEKYNPFYFEGEPCSLKYYQAWKKKEEK